MKFRPRFTLRLLLVVVTIAAVGLAGWRVFTHPRAVTQKDIEGVKVGMTAFEVRWRLGPPHASGSLRRPTWRYRIDGTFDYYFVEFEDGRVGYIFSDSYDPSIFEPPIL